MSELSSLLKKLRTNGLGEVLCAITFADNGDVRPDATPLSEEQNKTFLAAMMPKRQGWRPEEWMEEKSAYPYEGHSFQEGDLTIEVLSLLDGGETLYFRVKEGGVVIREVVSRHHEWEDI